MNARQRTNAEAIAVIVLLAAVLGNLVFGTTFHVVLGPPPGTRPVVRFWHSQLGSHFYTIDPNERAKINRLYSDIYIDEGVAFYAWPDPNGAVVK